uniref:membrane protein PM19L-like n=1 Tax=Erigeron canadensis TaxID=72917 RepID=UPI001CB98735|nr:membrane protein PM19L-like [Erigeron canadensis]
MAANDMRSVASFLMILNFAMYVTLLGLGGWAMNRAIDHGFIIGSGFALPAHFSPIYFPMGNAATGFFVTFSLIAGVVGVASIIASIDNIRSWGSEGRPAAASAALVAWGLTLLSMGFAWKEIELEGRNAALRAMEAFSIILSVTQFLYTVVLFG